MNIKFYEVGGCIRDELLGIESKDVDFTVVGPTFEDLVTHLEQEGFDIFVKAEQYGTIRAKVPAGHPLHSRTHVADFVLSRKDGPSTDGRRPDWVKPGTLRDDLERRDFTCNALARDTDTGEIIDLFGGVEDAKQRVLRFVGDPYERIQEDGLRVLRAFRFEITKGFTPDEQTRAALRSQVAVEMVHRVSIERIQEELYKMFRCDTRESLQLLYEIPESLCRAIFRRGLWLKPSLEKK